MKNHLTPSLASLFAASALALGLGSCIITIDDGGAHWGSYSAFHSSGHGPRHTGSGVTGEDARDLPGIHSVELEGSLDVDVTVAPGAPQRVTVVGDDNLLAHVRTEVRDGVLYVDLDSGSYRMKQELRVVATVSELRELDLEGSGDMSAFGVDAEVLAVHLDGSGDIELSGRARVLDLRLNGSGDIDAAALHAEDAVVVLHGSGDIRVTATEELEVRLDGSGDIAYRGNPRLRATLSGSGDLHELD